MRSNPCRRHRGRGRTTAQRALVVALMTGVTMTSGPLVRADAAGTATKANFSTESGRQIIGVATRAAMARGSVTASSTTTISGQKYSILTQSNLASGQQTLHVGAATTIVRVIGGVVYIRDTDTAIQAQFGISDPRYANRWIEIPATSSYFAHFNSDILLASLLSEIAPGGTLTTTKVTRVGVIPVIGVTGKPNIHLGLASGSETLYVTTAAPHVPVELVASDVVQGQRQTFVISFTRWGKKIDVTRPTPAVSIFSTNLPK